MIAYQCYEGIQFSAGFSLGEITAMVAAGALTLQDGRNTTMSLMCLCLTFRPSFGLPASLSIFNLELHIKHVFLSITYRCKSDPRHGKVRSASK